MTSNFKKSYIRDEKHRRWIASLPCCVTGIEGQTQCAHIRIGTKGGTSLKPSDNFCVPLSCESHARQHLGERTFWGEKIEAARELANALYFVSGNTEEAIKYIARFRRK